MTFAVLQDALSSNQILKRLPREKYEFLFSHLRKVSLTAHQMLYSVEDDIRCVYFINNGLASLLSVTAEGETIEVGNVGKEGVIGVPVLLREAKTPHQIVVQVPGDALVVSADILIHEFDKGGELRDRLLSYTHAFATYVSQLGVCNHFHTLDKRLCRWLLISSYQVQSQRFHLTHESLSQVLGTSRTAVTMAAKKLQHDGLIDYHRGEITILDRDAMAEISCNCYQISKDVLDHSLIA